jgi:hypothetical protein
MAIPHSRFKAKVLFVTSLVTLLGLGLAVAYPESQQAVATIVAAYSVFAAAIVGARAVHQWSAGASEAKPDDPDANKGL